MSSPTISVIMPVFNSEKYLEEAIESILNQTFTDFEFLIFDDGSTDRSPHIVKTYAARDSRIIADFSPVNKGYVVHLNEGIRRARGKYIARMDSDDLSLPGRLEIQHDFLEMNAVVGVLGSSTICINESGAEIGVDKRHSTPSYLFWRTFFTNPFAHPTVMYRTTIFEKAHGYEASKLPAEDYDLWTRVLPHWEFANVEEPLLKYRLHGDSVSSRNANVQLQHSGASLATLWQKETDICIVEDEWLFLKRFHLGYDNLPPVMALPLFRKLVVLKQLVKTKFVHIDRDIHLEFFRRSLYLGAKSKSLAFWKQIPIVLHLIFHYPRLTTGFLLHGKV